MDEKLTLRQQVEKDYHNTKYKHEFTKPSDTLGLDCAAYAFFYNLVNKLACGKILDFGCGDGWVSMKLAQQGHDIYGIDISEELVRKARNWAQDLGISHKAHFEEMAGENLIFEDNFFDAVIGSAVLHHTDFEMALDSIYRVLKPSGVGIFIEPMNENIMLKIWRCLTPWRRSPAERALGKKEIDIIAKRFPDARLHYFTLLSIFSVGLVAVFPKNSLLRRLNSLVEKIDVTVIKRFPKIRCYCAVVVMELEKG